MAVNVSFTLGNFPANYCYSTPAAFAADLIALLSGTISGNFAGVILGPNTPGVGDQDKVWVKTDTSGKPVGVFVFLGSWMWPHPIAPSDGERKIYIGTESSVWSKDGGDGTDPGTSPPTETTGAFWTVDHAFDFRMPLGAATSSLGTVVAISGTGGEEKHTLNGAETPEHQHIFGIGNSITDDHIAFLKPAGNRTLSASTNAARKHVSEADADVALTQGDLETDKRIDIVDSVNAHQNMPPFVGVYFIKRTIRKYSLG